MGKRDNGYATTEPTNDQLPKDTECDLSSSPQLKATLLTIASQIKPFSLFDIKDSSALTVFMANLHLLRSLSLGLTNLAASSPPFSSMDNISTLATKSFYRRGYPFSIFTHSNLKWPFDEDRSCSMTIDGHHLDTSCPYGWLKN